MINRTVAPQSDERSPRWVLERPACTGAIRRDIVRSDGRASMSETTNLAARESGPAIEWAAARRARRRRLLAIIGVACVVVLAGVITTVSIALHYAHGRPLANDGGGYGWAEPDNLTTRDVDLGPYRGLVARLRPGQEQSFCVELSNDSGVTQTILGLADDLPRARLLVSPPDGPYPYCSSENPNQALPVSLAPHATRVVRLTVTSPGCAPGTDVELYWDSLRLRVRVGWFTRTETVSLSNAIFELKKSC